MSKYNENLYRLVIYLSWDAPEDAALIAHIETFVARHRGGQEARRLLLSGLQTDSGLAVVRPTIVKPAPARIATPSQAIETAEIDAESVLANLASQFKF